MYNNTADIYVEVGALNIEGMEKKLEDYVNKTVKADIDGKVASASASAASAAASASAAETSSAKSAECAAKSEECADTAGRAAAMAETAANDVSNSVSAFNGAVSAYYTKTETDALISNALGSAEAMLKEV